MFDAGSVGEFPSPREFQIDAHTKLQDGFRAGHRCQQLMAPTGAGKSYIGLRLVKQALEKGKRALFVCDRTTLINQTSQTSDRYGLTGHGVIQSNHWRTNIYEPFQIGSVQTLARRGWPEADLIIIDESHTLYRAWTNHIKHTNAAVIGLSATPFARGMGAIFSNIVNASSMHKLTQDGVLVPMRVFSSAFRINMRGAKTIAGEWADAEVAERGLVIVGDVVREWLRVGENRKSILFGATIGHCESLCEKFNNAGVMAAVFTSETTAEEREILLNEFRKQDSLIRILISVEALAKGFDVPDVSCVMDCRPLRKSLSTAIQMWGRGLRSAHGKKDCLLLDFSGNIARFADDYADIFFNGLSQLDDGEKLDKTIRKDAEDEKEPAKCSNCGYSPCGKICVSCGNERKKKNLVENLEGKLSEVSPVKTPYAASEIWNQVCTYASLNGKPETAPGRAWHLYTHIMGTKPPRDFLYSNFTAMPVGHYVSSKIKQKNIAFAKSMGSR
jgi:superfamily II DNA or RNA helicase